MPRNPRISPVVPPKYLTAIGQVIAHWAMFEVHIDEAIHLFRVHPAALALTSKLPKETKKRIKLFRDSAEAAFNSYPALLPRLRSIAERASSLYGMRNELAHGMWFQARGPHYGTNLVYLGDWRRVSERMWSLERIKTVATQIGATHADLFHTLNGRSHLTSGEKAALGRFLHDNLPLPPTPSTRQGRV